MFIAIMFAATESRKCLKEMHLIDPHVHTHVHAERFVTFAKILL